VRVDGDGVVDGNEQQFNGPEMRMALAMEMGGDG